MTSAAPSTGAERCYVSALNLLNGSGVPYLVGGAYAMRDYAGIFRETKDLDVFCRPRDYPRLLAVLSEAGYRTEITYPHWIAKAFRGDYLVDVIFCSGNGLCEVDDVWFEHAPAVELLGCRVPLVPAEELLWSKMFVQYRERYDGADIAHVIRKQGPRLDWRRLLARVDEHWEVLYGQILNFRYVYPSERDTVPSWLMEELAARVRRQVDAPPPLRRICRGTLLAGPHYDVDILEWEYQDPRPLEAGQG